MASKKKKKPSSGQKGSAVQKGTLAFVLHTDSSFKKPASRDAPLSHRGAVVTPPPRPIAAVVSRAVPFQPVEESQLWVDKHRPSVDELAVNAKKAAEVRDWIERSFDDLDNGVSHARRLLLLLGPPGSGKTAVVYALAQQLKFEASEWFNTVHTRYSTEPEDVRTESRMEEFRSFVLRAKKYSALSFDENPTTTTTTTTTTTATASAKAAARVALAGTALAKATPMAVSSQQTTLSVAGGTADDPFCLDDDDLLLDALDAYESGCGVAAAAAPARAKAREQRKVLVLEDLPHMHGEQQAEAFRALMAECALSSRFPVILILSDERSGRTPARDVVGEALLRNPSVVSIRFREVAPTFVTKALRRIANLEELSVEDAVLKGLAETSGGDIRNAVNTLQFFACGLRPDPKNARDPRGKKRKRATTKSEKGKGGKGARANGDAEAVMPRVSGRDVSFSLLHAVGKVLNAKTKEDEGGVFEPAKILHSTEAEAPVITSFLHQNYLPFFTDIEDVAVAADHLSSAVAMSADWEKHEVMNAYAALAAMWGLASANNHPAPRRWAQVYKPDEFRVGRTARAMREQVRDTFGELSATNAQHAIFCDLLPMRALMESRRGFASAANRELLTALRGYSQAGRMSYHGRSETLEENDDGSGHAVADVVDAVAAMEVAEDVQEAEEILDDD